jgi:hypothetical protein
VGIAIDVVGAGELEAFILKNLESLDIWTSGHLDIWTSGHLDIWIEDLGSTPRWIHTFKLQLLNAGNKVF